MICIKALQKMLKLDVILRKLNYELDRRLPEGKNKN